MAVPIHIVANRLGHSDASTTLAVYAHVMPDDDRIAATAIADVLFRPTHRPTGPTAPHGPQRPTAAPRRDDGRHLGW